MWQHLVKASAQQWTSLRWNDDDVKLTMMIVATWAAINAYTPPEAPARYTLGSVRLVAKDPAATPAR